jgi:hypothetical protein
VSKSILVYWEASTDCAWEMVVTLRSSYQVITED